jgi:hypothetical protein
MDTAGAQCWQSSISCCFIPSIADLITRGDKIKKAAHAAKGEPLLGTPLSVSLMSSSLTNGRSDGIHMQARDLRDDLGISADAA